MEALSQRSIQVAPEKLVSQLAVRLRNHALWDALLFVLPPLLLSIDFAVSLYGTAWVSRAIAFIVLLAATAVGALAAFMRYRPWVPLVQSAARLMDQSARAKDRFLTLVTIEPGLQNASLVARLSQEAAEFGSQIEPKRDFPYRIKGSFYWSLAVSTLIALLFHSLLTFVPLAFRSPPAHERLQQLAEVMAQQPDLADTARALFELALKLSDPRLTAEIKQKLINDMQNKLNVGKKLEEQKGNRELLSQASATLKALQPQAGSGQNQKDDKGQGGGDIQSNLPHDKLGTGRESQGSGSESKGEISAQMNKNMQQGKTAEGNPEDQGSEKSAERRSHGQGNDPEKGGLDADKGKAMTAKTQGGKDEQMGRNKSSEDMPQGGLPAERFYQAGEKGRQGITGARYVIVELPEEVAADSKGEKTGSLVPQGRRGSLKVPLSNIPLPAHVPDALTEKQPMPLEYRGVLR